MKRDRSILAHSFQLEGLHVEGQVLPLKVELSVVGHPVADGDVVATYLQNSLALLEHDSYVEESVVPAKQGVYC